MSTNKSTFWNDYAKNSFQKTPHYADFEILKSVRQIVFWEENLIFLFIMTWMHYFLFTSYPKQIAFLFQQFFNYPLNVSYDSFHTAIALIEISALIFLWIFPFIIFKLHFFYKYFPFSNYSKNHFAKRFKYLLLFLPIAWYFYHFLLKKISSYKYYLDHEEELKKESSKKTKYVMRMGWHQGRENFLQGKNKSIADKYNALYFNFSLIENEKMLFYLSCQKKSNFFWWRLVSIAFLKIVIFNSLTYFYALSFTVTNNIVRLNPQINIDGVDKIFKAIIGIWAFYCIMQILIFLITKANYGGSILFICERLEIYYHADIAFNWQIFYMHNIFAFASFAHYQRIICKLWARKDYEDYFTDAIHWQSSLIKPKNAKLEAFFYSNDVF